MPLPQPRKTSIYTSLLARSRPGRLVVAGHWTSSAGENGSLGIDVVSVTVSGARAGAGG